MNYSQEHWHHFFANICTAARAFFYVAAGSSILYAVSTLN